MRWFKRDMWKAGIIFAGMLLLLVLMGWVPVSAAGAYEGASGLATLVSGTVQATPPANSTIANETANEQLRKLQRDNDRSLNAWVWNNGTTLFSSLALFLGGIFAIVRYFSDRKAERERRGEEQKRWLEDHKAEREKQAEERFQAAVEGLSSEREEAKVGAAITLRTFLRPGYEQFYTQTFDLAVAHLRLPRTPHPSEDPDGIPHSPEDPNTPLPLTTLRQVLIVVFKEVFPLARSQNDKRSPQSLDASGVWQDNAYLRNTDLKRIWMPQASLQKANLLGADLSDAFLNDTNFCGSCLNFTNLHNAFLNRAILSDALIIEANLSEAKFGRANLMKAHLDRANLSAAKLNAANLSWANLSGANLSGADLSWASLYKANLSGVRNLEEALSLKETDLRGVKGLTKEQLEACKAKGAIIDKDSTTDENITSSPPQSPISPSAHPLS
jgi:uncharacterized protein YjbI with pentapeptide repeats